MSYESEMTTKIEQIIDAAIESEMYHRGFEGDVASGFVGYPSSTEANSMPIGTVTVAGPHAANAGEARDDHGQVYRYGHDFFALTFDPVALYDKWRTQIPTMFEPWLQIPNPDDFRSKVTAARDAAEKLSLSVEVQGAGGTGATLVGANDVLSGDLGFLGSKIGNYDGATILTFHQDYVSRMPLVIGAQGSAACILGVCLAAQQEIWTRTRASLLDVATQSVEAMKGARGGGGSFKSFITVLGAIASGVTIFAGGPVTGGIATGLGILGTFLPEDQDTENAEELAGEHPDDVVVEIQHAFDETKRAISETELKAREGLSNARFEIYGNPDYDLARPAGLLGETDLGDLTTVDDTYVELDVLRQLGRETMEGIATELDGAAGLLTASAGDGIWNRPYDIGISDRGYYWEWEQLLDILTRLVPDTAWEVRQAGEHLAIAAGIMQENDELVREDLEAIHSRLAEHANQTADGSPISQSSSQSGTPLR